MLDEQYHFVHFPGLFMLGLSFFTRRYPSEEEKKAWILPIIPIQKSKAPRITWVGHATFLIQIDNCNILTDPVWGAFSRLFPRILPEGIEFDLLPHIDKVLISHNHFDHMDLKTLQHLLKRDDPEILVPRGNKNWFLNRGFKVEEYGWWEEEKKDDLTFSFLPACHWSQRKIFQRNRSLWGSWMISSPLHTIYFGGDSAYGRHFSEISQEFSAIDIALLPLGPCEPRRWLKHSHMDSSEVGKAFLDLQATTLVLMHWGTFPFGTDYFDMPIKQLQQWWSGQHEELKEKKLNLLKVGEPLVIEYQQKIPEIISHSERMP